MNATVLTAEGGPTSQARSSSVLGLKPLLGKEFLEWRRSRRAWITPLIVAPVLGLTAANSRINEWVLKSFPAETAGQPAPVISQVPLDNFLAAIGTQAIVIAAILATIGLVAVEFESGTLAWTASKPVSRLSMWLSKWIAASLMLVAVAVVLPVLTTTIVVVALYGPLNATDVALTIAGEAALVVLFTAISLAVGVYFRSQAVVMTIALGAFALPAIVGGLYGPINDILPTSILGWTIGLGSGQPTSPLTPIAWLISVGLIVAIGVRRTRRMEF